jgi:hypothetical protein
VPAGQLDGGHVAYALFGSRQNTIARTVHRSTLAFFFVSFASYLARDIQAGIGLAHVGRALDNSLFWLVWFQLLSLLGTVSGSHPDLKPQTPVLPPRVRLLALIWVALLGSHAAQANQPFPILVWFLGLGLLLAIEAKAGVLRDHPLVDHPPTGDAPLDPVRKGIAIVTLAFFGALFMPTPFALH